MEITRLPPWGILFTCLLFITRLPPPPALPAMVAQVKSKACCLFPPPSLLFWRREEQSMLPPPSSLPAMVAQVKNKTGFEWINESKTERPKWGFVATKPGSVIKISIDTTATASQVQGECTGVLHHTI